MPSATSQYRSPGDAVKVACHRPSRRAMTMFVVVAHAATDSITRVMIRTPGACTDTLCSRRGAVLVGSTGHQHGSKIRPLRPLAWTLMASSSMPSEVANALTTHGYLPDEGLATAIFLALSLKRPLLLEGEAGVGKTEVAKVLSRWTGGQLIRLQCYEGIDAAQAVYDWDYSRQLLHLRAAEASGEAQGRSADALEGELYHERFLLKRALLQAIDHKAETPPVLLIDEVDRADDEFEAYLLEVLSDYQITIPELGVFSTTRPPVVILTSNRTRDVHDALKRRCLYHWVEHPTFEREVKIVRMRVPHVIEPLARQVAGAVEAMRTKNLYKPPGVAETIDWAAALAALGVSELDEATVDVTLGAVLKYREDQDRVRQNGGIADIVKQAFERGAYHG
jgi:MoxR-like ATPase